MATRFVEDQMGRKYVLKVSRSKLRENFRKIHLQFIWMAQRLNSSMLFCVFTKAYNAKRPTNPKQVFRLDLVLIAKLR